MRRRGGSCGGPVVRLRPMRGRRWSGRRVGFACGAALALFAWGSHAATAQHTLTLVNGDRLTGRLRDIQDGVWTFHFRGTDLRVPVDSVSGLRSESLIGLRLRDGTVLGVTIEPVANALALTLADSSVRLADPRDVVAVGPADDLRELRRRGVFGRALERWIVTGSLGF